MRSLCWGAVVNRRCSYFTPSVALRVVSRRNETLQTSPCSGGGRAACDKQHRKRARRRHITHVLLASGPLC